MKTVGKLITSFILLIALAIAVAVYLAVANLDSLVEDGIETYGSDMLKTSVAVGSVSISLADGGGKIEGLSIGNPAGFSDSEAFAIDQVAINVDVDSLKNLLDKTASPAVVVIDTVDIAGAKLLLEQKGVDKNNLQTLMNNLKSASASGATNQEGGDSSGRQDIRLAIRQFNFIDADVTVSSDIAGSKELDLPAIRLKNIGSDDGAPVEEVARQIIEPILAAAIKQGKQGLVDEALDKALDNDKLKGVKSLLQGLGGQ
jgi:hypothetical protein